MRCASEDILRLEGEVSYYKPSIKCVDEITVAPNMSENLKKKSYVFIVKFNERKICARIQVYPNSLGLMKNMV